MLGKQIEAAETRDAGTRDAGAQKARAGFIPQGILLVSHFLQPGLIVYHFPTSNITLHDIIIWLLYSMVIKPLRD